MIVKDPKFVMNEIQFKVKLQKFERMFGTKLICNGCRGESGETYASRSTFRRRHSKTCFGAVQCRKCGQQYKSHISLKLHEKKCNGGKL